MRIATFGDINIDVVLDVDDLPCRGGEVFSTRRGERLGGSAVNTAVVLARLGFESTVMGTVGDDVAGHRALLQLGSTGVSTDLTSVSQTYPTSMNTVLVTPDRERTMIGARGANVYHLASRDWHTGVAWLHISGYSLMEGPQQRSALEVMETAARLGIPSSLDVPVGVGARIRDVLTDRIAGFRIISGSRQALCELTASDNPDKELSGAVRQVAITSGSGRLLLMQGPEAIKLTPPSVDAVDATGAGDAFAAGLITAAMSDLAPGPTGVLAAATGAAATMASGASEILADPDVWSYLLDGARWSDADPAWLEEVRTWVLEHAF